MNHCFVTAVIVAMVLLLAVVFVSLRARRLDRLHQTVVKSRRALELALRARAHYAQDFATSGGLDVAGGILLADAADASLGKGMLPIVDDGLDGLDMTELKLGDRGGADDRRSIESSLSRTLRLTVDELEAEEIRPEAIDIYDRLNESRLEVRMTRTFHNSHVDQIRRVRRTFLARVFHLAGRAPIPSTVDIDDE
ncbi:MAG: hypothetical protein Q3979_07805 [Actinomycetaceae bacterium]|nr:hypothetical protein [Actinomycetaceae bacterium]